VLIPSGAFCVLTGLFLTIIGQLLGFSSAGESENARTVLSLLVSGVSNRTYLYVISGIKTAATDAAAAYFRS
jgi:hypothetical protein